MGLLLTVATSVFAARHPGPSVWGDVKFADGFMIVTIEGAADPLRANIDLDVLPLGPLPEETVESIREHIVRYFTDHNPVMIDGVRVIPTLSDLIIQDGTPDEASWKSCRFELDYECPSLPRQLSFRWDRFEGEGIEFIPVVINVPDATPMMFSMFPDEPEYIWHAADIKRRRASEFQAVKTESRGKIEVPLPSAALALLAVLSAVALRFTSWRRTSLVVPLAALAAAVLLRDTGRAEVEVPWQTRVHLPAPSQAEEIFKALHGNIYAAFELQTEDDIYELLATSVDVAILDELYADVYESLILREQGGAICAIEGVDYVSTSVDMEAYKTAEEPAYRVDCAWQVHGIVSHWGHIHRRMNEYKAEYTVRHDGASWKIAAVDVKEHKRTEEYE